jgi:ATP-dependent Clp protease ATP-binding subunit ClpX
MSNNTHKCSFCGVEQSAESPLIAGLEGHICESCVSLAHQVVSSWGHKRAHARPLQKPPVPREIKARLDSFVIGQDDAKETLAVAVYNHYKRLAAEAERPRVKPGGIARHPAAVGDAPDAAEEGSRDDGEPVEIEKSNILLLGPTGTGKTLLAGTLARIVGVPFVVADATTLTQAGYVGEDVESILVRLMDAADGRRELAEWGIVYIDEIDKLAHQGENAHGTRDVSGEGVQQALLKLVEGTRVKLNPKGRKESAETAFIDTRNILFIAGGAFAGLEKLLERRLTPRAAIGFHAASEAREPPPMARLYQEVEPEDLRHFGLIPEFIGRFPVLTALHDLDAAALVRILTEPRNALVRQYQQLFAFEGVRLELTPEALRAIAQKALDRGTGARGLRGVLEALLRRTMFDLPSMPNVAACHVDEDAVTNGTAIELIPSSAEDSEPAQSASAG